MTRVRQPGTSVLAAVEARDPATSRLVDLCRRAARSALPMLIEGEAGAGKRFFAKAIHDEGDRAAKPFVAVDCAALPWDRADALLFGVRRNGAADSPGSFGEARGGTLLLRNVAELPEPAQSRLMQALATGEVLPVGASRAERPNVRVIAASRPGLLDLARAGDFHRDLYQRLAVLPIHVPSLRGRTEAIAAFSRSFASQISSEMGKPIAGIAPEAMALLHSFDWPQNVRQLENTICRAVALAESDWLQPADFPQLHATLAGRAAAIEAAQDLNAASATVHLAPTIPRRKQTEGAGAMPDRFLTDGELTPLADLERELIRFAFQRYGGRMSAMARALQIGRSTLYRKLREYGLDGALDRNAA